MIKCYATNNRCLYPRNKDEAIEFLQDYNALTDSELTALRKQAAREAWIACAKQLITPITLPGMAMIYDADFKSYWQSVEGKS